MLILSHGLEALVYRPVARDELRQVGACKQVAHADTGDSSKAQGILYSDASLFRHQVVDVCYDPREVINFGYILGVVLGNPDVVIWPSLPLSFSCLTSVSVLTCT